MSWLLALWAIGSFVDGAARHHQQIETLLGLPDWSGNIDSDVGALREWERFASETAGQADEIRREYLEEQGIRAMSQVKERHLLPHERFEAPKDSLSRYFDAAPEMVQWPVRFGENC